MVNRRIGRSVCSRVTVQGKRRRGLRLVVWYLAWLRVAIANSLIAAFPSYTVRHAFYRWICGIKLGRNARIMKGVFVLAPQRIEIGENSVINNDCLLDGRGGLRIGKNVNIAFDVHVYTMSHDYNDPFFSGVFGPVSIEDYVWLGSRSTILPGVTAGYGAVVAAGAVVTSDIAPFTVVAGVPAKPIGTRNRDLRYQLDFIRPWH
jgi:acetyltransferase-like isoleucine patch superfamily enzyme